jgi:hypothetical protein
MFHFNGVRYGFQSEYVNNNVTVIAEKIVGHGCGHRRKYVYHMRVLRPERLKTKEGS